MKNKHKYPEHLKGELETIIIQKFIMDFKKDVINNQSDKKEFISVLKEYIQLPYIHLVQWETSKPVREIFPKDGYKQFEPIGDVYITIHLFDKRKKEKSK